MGRLEEVNLIYNKIIKVLERENYKSGEEK